MLFLLVFFRSLIELFEIDKERQHRGVIRKEGKIIPADDHKTSTDISFVPSDLEDERWGKPLQRIINTVEVARQDWIAQYYMGLDRLIHLKSILHSICKDFYLVRVIISFTMKEPVLILVIE